MRPEVQGLMRISEAIGKLADGDGLTEDERVGVVACIDLLQQKLGLSAPQVDEEIPLASPLAHVPLID